MKKTKLYFKKSLSIFMAAMMLMTAWVFVAPEKAEAVSAATVSGDNNTKIAELNGLDFGTGFTTVSGNFQGDNASTMASRGYYKNVLYSPHFPASNNNLTNNDAGVFFGNLGNTADGARVWYPETTLIWDGSTTPQIPILFDIDSNNNNRVGVKNVYISSGANGLTFKDSYWTAKSECGKDKNYYTHFTFDWIMQNNSGNYWISTSSSNDKESMCSTKGYWDIYGTYLQYTGGAFGSGSTYYKEITPTWVCRTGSNYTGTTKKTIYVIDYVPLKNALSSVQGIIDSINRDSAKYTTASVAAFVDAAKKLVAAKPNNYINSSKNDVSGWNTAVSAALRAYNSAKNLVVQKYTVTFKDIDGNVDTYSYDYGTSVNLTSLAANHPNTVKQNSDEKHMLYIWPNDVNGTRTITNDLVFTEIQSSTEDHKFSGNYVQDANEHSDTCSVCNYTRIEAHKYNEKQGYVTKAETCTENGVMTYDCSVCGKKAIATSVIDNIKGHDFSGTAVENVEGENGSHWRKCSRCDVYGWGTTVDACEKHNWDKNGDGTVNATDATSLKASTCKEAGFETYTCKVCSATWTKTLALAEHKITATAAKLVDETTLCGVEGNYAFWTCSACDRVWKDSALTDELLDTADADGDRIPDALEIESNPHEFTGAYASVSGGENGTHHRQCKRFTQCGTYGPEASHNWGEPAVTASTCTATGKKVYTCADCNQTYTETIEKLAHEMTKIDAVAPKCGVAGNNEYYYCSTCSKYYKDEAATTETTVAKETLAALTHKWTAHHDYDTLKTAATCQAAAVYNNHCDYCKEEIIGTSHIYGNPDTVNGHKFNGDFVKNADGTHSYKCTVAGCNEAGNATKCTYEVTKDVASTCKTAGYTTYECTTCGNGYTDIKATDPNNHSGEGTYIIGNQAPTCATFGSTGIEKCSGCNTTLSTKLKDIPVDPSNHEAMKLYEAQDSTCQTQGWNEYEYCSACQTYNKEKVMLDLKAHKFTTYTSNNDGTHTAICDTCVATVATPATDTKACSGGTANCVDKAVCEICKVAYGDVVATNHKTVVTVDKVNPTCQTVGYTAYKHCNACNKNITEPKEIDMLKHTYGAWTKLEGQDKHTRSCTTCVDTDELDVATETVDCNGGTAYCDKLAKCVDCKAEYGTYNAANHSTTASHIDGAIEATCQKEGFTGNRLYDCCNAVKQAGTSIEKKEHSFTKEIARKAATCIAEGSVTYECSTCVDTDELDVATHTEEIAINAKNHASTETVVKNQKAATCEEDGNTGDVYYVCCYVEGASAADNKKALKEKGTTIKANGQHVYGDAIPEYMAVITDGVLTEGEEPSYGEKIAARRDDNKWYHAQQCTVCGIITYGACYTYEHTYNCTDTDICEVCDGLCSLKDENKHVNFETIARVEATHTTDGHKEYYQCKDCGKYFLDDAGKKSFNPDSEEGQALINISKDTVPCTEWEEKPFETKEATCIEDGYEKYRCTIEGCTRIKTVVIPALADSHVWSEGEDYKVIKAPTCGKNGYKAHYCTVCDAIKPNDYVIMAAEGEHTFVLVDTILGSSCLDPTTKLYKCSVCDAEKTETVYDDQAAHIWGAWVNIGGDCSTGVIMERECTVIGCNAKEQETRDSDTHAYKVTAYIAPTKESEGLRISVCENCGDEKREVIPYTSGEGEGGETPEEPEVEHLINDEIYTVVKEASCESPEIRRYTCLHCGELVEKAYGEALEHVWIEQKAELATCTMPGRRDHYKCVRCEEIYNDGRGDVVIEKIPHEDLDKNGKCDRCNGVFYGSEPNTACGCICHKENGIMKFIYKIISFFWKLFKIGRTCDCGYVHY